MHVLGTVAMETITIIVLMHVLGNVALETIDLLNQQCMYWVLLLWKQLPLLV
jgi:hypothetical protein